MHKRTAFPVIAIALGLLLSGCANLQRGWDGAMTEIGLYGPPQQPAPSPMPDTNQGAVSQAGSAGAAADWCRQYATSSAQTAARSGYDAATQKRRYETTYRQCAALPDGAPVL